MPDEIELPLSLIANTFSGYFASVFPVLKGKSWQDTVSAIVSDVYREENHPMQAYGMALCRVREQAARAGFPNGAKEPAGVKRSLSVLRLHHECLLHAGRNNPAATISACQALYGEIHEYLTSHYLRHLFADGAAQAAHASWLATHDTMESLQAVLDPILEIKLFMVDHLARHPMYQATMKRFERTLNANPNYEKLKLLPSEIRCIKQAFSCHWDLFLHQLQHQLRHEPFLFGHTDAALPMQVATDQYESWLRKDFSDLAAKTAPVFSNASHEPDAGDADDLIDENLEGRVFFDPGTLNRDDIQSALNEMPLGPEKGPLILLSFQPSLLWLHFRQVVIPHVYIRNLVTFTLSRRREAQQVIVKGNTVRDARKRNIDTVYLRNDNNDLESSLLEALEKDVPTEVADMPEDGIPSDTGAQPLRLHALEKTWQARKKGKPDMQPEDGWTLDVLQETLNRMASLLKLLRAHASQAKGNLVADALLHLAMLGEVEPKHEVLTRFQACQALEDIKHAPEGSTRRFFKEQFIAFQLILQDWHHIDAFMDMLVRCIQGAATQITFLGYLQQFEPESGLNKESTLSKRLSKHRTQVRLLLCAEHHALLSSHIKASHMSPGHRERYRALLDHWAILEETASGKRTRKEASSTVLPLQLDSLLLAWLSMETLIQGLLGNDADNGTNKQHAGVASRLVSMEAHSFPPQVMCLMRLYLAPAHHEGEKPNYRLEERSLSLLPEGRMPESEMLHLFSGKKDEYRLKMDRIERAVQRYANGQQRS